MSFYLEITERTLRFGGLRTIQVDWQDLPQTTGRVFTEPDGRVSSPIGIWVLGSSIKTGFVSALLRGRTTIDDEYLTKLAGENNVRIVVATTERCYVYRNYARVFTDYVERKHLHLNECTRELFEEASSRKRIPSNWIIEETNYF